MKEKGVRDGILLFCASVLQTADWNDKNTVGASVSRFCGRDYQFQIRFPNLSVFPAFVMFFNQSFDFVQIRRSLLDFVFPELEFNESITGIAEVEHCIRLKPVSVVKV